MTTKGRMGRIFAGVVLALSFIVAAPAQAEITRGTQTDDILTAIYTFTFDSSSLSGVVAWENYGVLDGFGRLHTFGDVRGGGYQNFLTVWFEGTDNPFDGFAAELTGGDPDSLKIGSFAQPYGDEGDFFYGFLLSDTDLVFDFGSGSNLQFVFTLYGVNNRTTIPEPATIALLGLGLAGLVAARRRKK